MCHLLIVGRRLLSLLTWVAGYVAATGRETHLQREGGRRICIDGNDGTKGCFHFARKFGTINARLLACRSISYLALDGSIIVFIAS